jgi:UDP-3-O-[3-hydroxymyristoyl] glucosamine N-acyltransferase
VVVLEDGVEIGANSCIDRATMGATTLASGAKLDNLVQVAHNAFIGEHSVIAAQAGIAGSTRLGRQVMVGGQAGFVGHITIADGTKIDAQSGVNKTIEEPGQAFRGSPIQPHRQQLRSELMFRKLAEMEARIRSLEQELSQLRPPIV